MARIGGLSPLSTRDLNRRPYQQDDHDNSAQNRQDAASSVEEIKARFDRDFLPKYGHLWRQIIREKDCEVAAPDSENSVNATTGYFETSLPNPRALNFLEAIERKQTVSISAVPDEEDCECSQPIEEFSELNEEQTRNITLERRKNRTYSSNDEVDENLAESSEPVSDEETETERDEEDMESVYETADEFEDEDDLQGDKSTHLVEQEANRVGIESSAKSKKTGNNSKKIIIDIESDSDDTVENASKFVRSRNSRTGFSRNSNCDGPDKSDQFGLGVSKLRIAADTKPTTIDPFVASGKSPCLSPRMDDDIPSPTGSNSTSNAIVNDPLIDTDNEGDDEYDSESDEEEEEEAEWLPDDTSIQSIQRKEPQSKKPTENKTVEKQMTRKTIDLCDSSSSSSDDAADSEFWATSDDDGSVATKKSMDKKQIAIPPLVKKTKEKGKSKASFRRNREKITAATFDEFNRKAFRGGLGQVVVQWSQKLNTTAGLTRLQKVSKNMTPGVPLKRIATIELSTKVVDDEEKLRTTLLHELVHAAVWIFEGVAKPPHGADFKRWAKIAMSKVPDVIVTTTHNYVIEYKFNWKCVNPDCSFTIGRHSKSVDVVRHRCGRCKGKLIEVTKNGTPKKRAAPSAYNLFVKQYSKVVREQLAKRKPGVTQAEVMKELGRLWREKKSQSLESVDQ